MTDDDLARAAEVAADLLRSYDTDRRWDELSGDEQRVYLSEARPIVAAVAPIFRRKYAEEAARICERSVQQPLSQDSERLGWSLGRELRAGALAAGLCAESIRREMGASDE